MRIVAAFLMFFIFSAFTGLQAANNPLGPDLEFTQVEYDFGKIPEGKKKVSFDYVFTNTGDSPVVITRVITSCRCIDVKYPKRPIAPGAQGAVTVIYDPKKQRGIFYKAIQVYTNTSKERYIIRAKGEVVTQD